MATTTFVSGLPATSAFGVAAVQPPCATPPVDTAAACVAVAAGGSVAVEADAAGDVATAVGVSAPAPQPASKTSASRPIKRTNCAFIVCHSLLAQRSLFPIDQPA